MKKAYVIHGWGAHPEDNWFLWLKAELEKNGFYVKVPQMPNTDYPHIEEWLAKMNEIIKPDNETYLIGHSLGVITILKYIESLNKKIKAAILVSGFSESILLHEIENFTEENLNYDKVKKTVEKIIAIHSDNDPYVPISCGEILKEKLDAKLIILKNQGHINTYNNKFELPVALDEILNVK